MSSHKAHRMQQLMTVFCLFTWFASVSHASKRRQLSDHVEELLNSDNYNSRTRPDADLGQALDVAINMNVNDISSISEVQMEFSVTLYLRQVWRDRRLSYANKGFNRSITLNHNQFDRMWTPDIFIRNLKKGIFHTITVPNRLIRLSPDGTILYSQRLTLTLACDMVLDKYPMDNQTCKIEFGSYAYTTEDLWFKWRENVTEVEVNPSITLPEYNLEGVAHEICQKKFSSTGAFPCLRAHFKFERRLRAYVLSTYLPSLLVVLLSWVSFWIDLDAVPARISLGILTILTITTQGATGGRAVPAVSFTKAIDVWMATCLVFVFGAFIEYSVVNVLARRDKHAKFITKDCNCASCLQAGCGETESLGEGAYTAANVATEDDNQWDDANENMSLSNGPADDGTVNHGRMKCPAPAEAKRIRTAQDSTWCYRMKNNKALMVDVLSRILFPLLFLVFNVIYWPVYLL